MASGNLSGDPVSFTKHVRSGRKGLVHMGNSLVFNWALCLYFIKAEEAIESES